MEPATPKNYWRYNKKLLGNSRKLKKRMTKAEVYMWKYVLRASKMKGYKFVRQRPVLNYIADFMSKDLMLIIEIDGKYHEEAEQMERDRIREKALKNIGFHILRFKNEEVLSNISTVRMNLEDWIDKQEKARERALSK
ncbi:MAG: DUF559 domain-containing protein [Bacteroidota bacterium]